MTIKTILCAAALILLAGLRAGAADQNDAKPQDEAAAVVRQLEDPLRAMIRQELREALASKATDFADSFPVDASCSAWQYTGVRVKEGQHVLVQPAEGEMWNAGWGLIDAKGYLYPQDPNAGTPLFHTGTQGKDWHWGALICAVGPGRSELNEAQRQVEIGLKRGFTVDSDGYLYLLCNNSAQLADGGSGYDNSSGIIHVKMTVTEAVNNPDAKPDGRASPAGSPAVEEQQGAAAASGAPVAGGGRAGTIAHQLQDPLRKLIRQELWTALATGRGNHDVGSFPVDAVSEAWQNSGVRVKAGQHVMVQANAEDRWNISWGSIDANGYQYLQNSGMPNRPVFHTGTPLVDWHWGALICAMADSRKQINDPGNQFETGLRHGFTANKDGYLYFICNDDRFDDNAGVVHVKITVTNPATDPKIKANGSPSQVGADSPAASFDSPSSSPSASPEKNNL